MKNRSLKLAAGLVMVSATLVAGASDAQASSNDTAAQDKAEFFGWLGDWGWGGGYEDPVDEFEDPDLGQDNFWCTWWGWCAQPETRVEICALDYFDNTGLYKRSVRKRRARRLVRWQHYSYVKAEENCDTDFDDNCDGHVNEGCSTDPVCGNGVLEAGEECDDGNRINRDGCTNKCKIKAFCGNGIKEGNEECDDGNRWNGDGCTRRCKLESVCGNGVKEAGEECDDGNQDNFDGCTRRCKVRAICGDGVKEGKEECDDGNRANGDGCSARCKIQAVCGNGVKEGNEECDDGNNVNNDACTNDCMIFDNVARCGNGIVEAPEQCDDGNQVNNDDCTNDCKLGPVCGNGMLESGEECDDGNDAIGDGCEDCKIKDVCGDGITSGDEECDDGNTIIGDGCDEMCKIEEICGDGVMNQTSEECDDGNLTNGDGCNDQCKKEPVCGNNVREGNEKCDDGNQIDDDTCNNDCTIARECGNGELEPTIGEECDAGLQNGKPGSGCTEMCKKVLCGNGQVDGNEQCDDGNTIDDDACSNQCMKNPICGDGEINQGSEKCDDGNTENGDGCDENCQLEPKCGDGEVNQASEECDDKNTIPGDGCDADCKIEECGDGKKNQASEECDDGNKENGDGCDADCKIEPFCGDGLVNQPSEKCDDGAENNGPGKRCASNCTLTIGLSCGDGVVNAGDECDNGEDNGKPGNSCSAECKFVAPPAGTFAYETVGKEDCKSCMETKCLSDVGACAADSACVALSACHANNSCLDPVLGPLSCLCGDNVNTTDCQATPNLDSFQGACASEIIAASGVTPETDKPIRALIAGFLNRGTSSGVANGMYVCMGRRCVDECSELIDTDEPVCGNGVVEGEEKCDDGNKVAKDGCENDCTVTVDEPTFKWYATQECDDCMAANCADREAACFGDPQCEALVKCEGEANCIDTFLGPLACLCGKGQSVPQCQGTPSIDKFKGECAAQIVAGLGTETVGATFPPFSNPASFVGRAHQAFICMSRRCKAQCTENIYND